MQQCALTCMNVGMFLHVRFLVKSFTTELTRVWPGVRMYQQMSGQGRRPLERFATLFALENFLYIVHRSTTTQPPGIHIFNTRELS